MLWLWLAAVAAIRPIAWEPPYVTGTALKRQKKKKMTYAFLEVSYIYKNRKLDRDLTWGKFRIVYKNLKKIFKNPIMRTFAFFIIDLQIG